MPPLAVRRHDAAIDDPVHGENLVHRRTAGRGGGLPLPLLRSAGDHARGYPLAISQQLIDRRPHVGDGAEDAGQELLGPVHARMLVQGGEIVAVQGLVHADDNGFVLLGGHGFLLTIVSSGGAT